MPWLIRDSEVLASLEVIESSLGRVRGLIGREVIEGAVLLRPAKAVHTIGMRAPVDVAFCDGDLVVLAVLSGVAPYRLTMPRPRSACVIEAEAGAFARWGLKEGDRLEIKG